MGYHMSVDEEALNMAPLEAITELTERATLSTFYREDLTQTQRRANQRIVKISAAECSAASRNAHQSFVAGFAEDVLMGYVIATRHAPDDLELDWMMVCPEHHGRGLSNLLMDEGLRWLGNNQPIWLNVIAHNKRAIRFYNKFGFSVDPAAKTNHVIPHLIMRRYGQA